MGSQVYYVGTTLVKAGVSFRNSGTVADFAKVGGE